MAALLLPLQTGFLRLGPTLGAGPRFAVGRGAVLGPAPCSAASLAFAFQVPGTPPPQNPDNPKCLQTLPEVPRETESHSVEKRRPRQSAPSRQGPGLPSSLLQPKVLNLRKCPSDARGHCRETHRARHPGASVWELWGLQLATGATWALELARQDQAPAGPSLNCVA